MSARATFLTSFRALIEAVSNLTEHKGAVTEAGLPATVARVSTGASFVVSMPAGTWSGGRQRGDLRFEEAVVVGFLVDVRQADRPDAYGRAMTLEDAILTATLGSAKVAGWQITWQGSERSDVGEGAYLGVRMAFTASGSTAVGA